MPRVARRAARVKGKDYSTYQLTNKVRRLATTVRKNAPEINYTNALQAPVNITLAGTVIPLVSYPVQGDGDLERTGDRITVRDIDFRFSANGLVNRGAIRVLVFVDKRAQGILTTDIMESGTVGAALANNTTNGFMVHDYRSRYHVLMDRVIDFSDTGDKWKTIHKRFRFKKGLNVEFLAGGTTPIRNALKVMIWGTEIAHQYQWQSRMHFSG